jgi:Flp pilus assembly protein TadD
VYHYNLAVALHGKGKLEEAVACYRKAIALDPKYAHAHENLGVALVNQGKVEEAVACYRKAIALDPQVAAYHHNLGVTLDGKGQVDEAIVCYRKAIALDPQHVLAHYNLGVALHGKGKLEEAVACYRKAVALDPAHVQAHENLGIALVYHGKVEEAVACYRKAIALVPGQKARLTLLLWGIQAKADAQAKRVQAVQGRLAAFRKGDYEPRNNDERLGLALLCERQGLYLTAARLYADALAADRRLAEDLQAGQRMQAGLRYDAACCAALASGGRGEGAAGLDDRERARWRRQALDWLKAELLVCGKKTNSWFSAVRNGAYKELRSWQHDSSLAGIRDPDAVTKLPAEERQACERLWADVATLLKKAEEKAR